MAFSNYSELVASINDWLDRSDLSGVADDMIVLAESRLRRELAPYFTETSTTSTSASTGAVTLPGDVGTINRVIYDGQAIPQIDKAVAADGATGTVPVAYTVEAGAVRLWPAGAYEVTILYNPIVPHLTATNPTNAVFLAHPDLYFYGAMLYANGYLSDDQRAASFAQLWDASLEEAKRYMTRQAFAGPLVPKVGFVP